MTASLLGSPVHRQCYTCFKDAALTLLPCSTVMTPAFNAAATGPA